MARQKTWLIGSGTDCDVVVPHPNVSANHCRLTRSATGFVVEDLQSSNGTFVNGVRVVEPIAVSRQDQITLGRTVEMPWPGSGSTSFDEGGRGSRRAVESTASAGSAGASPSRSPHEAVQVTVTLRGSAMVLGRDPQCDHVLEYPMVSWRHARITRDGASLFVEDLNSSNGTFVNGVRIRERTVVKPGDDVGLGSYRFSVGTDGSLRQRDYRGDLTIEARGICVDAGGRRLLEKVSLTIYPSEFVGLMGPSGAGKSTLMNVLNGYTPPEVGQVLVNGRNLYEHFDEFRGMIGFVPQDDIIHADLTVREALFFSARLRLPKDFSNRDIHKRIDDVLSQLGLTGIDNVLIGSPARRGISGGQRKRVNLAMELLTDPSVLFLDEPTSGLSSEDTLIVMQVLRQLADSGKTILLTIHQPSLEAFRKLDDVVVVAKDAGTTEPGRLAFFGPAYPGSIQFFNPPCGDGRSPDVALGPDLLLRGLATQPTAVWCQRFQASEFHRKFVTERVGCMVSGDKPTSVRPKRVEMGLNQCWTLMRRTLAVKRRDVTNTAILLMQAPVIAILLVIVFSRNTSVELTPENWRSSAQATSITVFLMALSAIWFGCSNSVREIISEWPVYLRERMVNLQIPWYVASKIVVLGALCLVQCAVLLGIVHWGNGLHASWPAMFEVLALSSAVGMALGLAISAIVKTSEVAIALLPLILLPMVILGGILQPLNEMSTVGRLGSSVVPSRWSFEALLLLESSERQPKASPASANGAVEAQAMLATNPSIAGQPSEFAELYFPKRTERMGVTFCKATLAAMAVLLFIAIQLALRSRDLNV